MDLVPKEYRQKDAQVILGKKPAFSLNKASLNLSGEKKDSLLKAGVVLTALVFVLACALWAGLSVYEKSLGVKIQDTQAKQDKIFAAKDKEAAKSIIDFGTGATLIQTLLKNHIYSSSALEQIKISTLPQVQWQSLSLDVKKRSLILKGRAANYSTLARQILAFQEDGFIDVTTSGITLDKSGGIAFQIEAGFEQKLIASPKNE